LKQPAQ